MLCVSEDGEDFSKVKVGQCYFSFINVFFEFLLIF